MGMKASKSYITDWEHADGHVKQYQTLDRMEPFKHHETLILSHENQREFQIRRSHKVLYFTKAVPNTAFWFDVCRKYEEPILQVRGHPWKKQWDILSYHIPSYVGQDAIRDESSSNHPLYRKARIHIDWKLDRAEVQLCQPLLTEIINKGEKTAEVWSDPILIYYDADRIYGNKGQTYRPDDHDTLISYLEMSADHKYSFLHLAKNCDIALHVILTVISSIIHCNNSPFLSRSTDAFMPPEGNLL
jgi:hypothetical protein